MATNAEMLDILKKIDQEVLTSPERWTRGWYARDADGYEINSIDWASSGWTHPSLAPQATRWCLMGASVKACGEHKGPFELLSSALALERIAEFNDAVGRTFEDIKGLLATRIAALEAQIIAGENKAETKP